jgi:hypothetical protein
MSDLSTQKYYYFDSDDDEEPFKVMPDETWCIVYFICYMCNGMPSVSAYSYYYLDPDDITELIGETEMLSKNNPELNEIIFKSKKQKTLTFFRVKKMIVTKMDTIQNMTIATRHFTEELDEIPFHIPSKERMDHIKYILDKFELDPKPEVDKFILDEYESDKELEEKKKTVNVDIVANQLDDSNPYKPSNYIDRIFIKPNQPQLIINYLWDDRGWVQGESKRTLQSKRIKVISYTKHGDESMFLHDFGEIIVCSEIPKTKSLFHFLRKYDDDKRFRSTHRQLIIEKLCEQFSLYKFYQDGQYIKNCMDEVIYKI